MAKYCVNCGKKLTRLNTPITESFETAIICNKCFQIRKGEKPSSNKAILNRTGITDIEFIKEEKEGCLPGLATGCASGIGGGIILMIIGSLLSITGIGAIIGIPLIILGIFMIFGGPAAGALFGMVHVTMFKGICPYCGKNIEGAYPIEVTDCIFCKERIFIEENKLYTKEKFFERNKAITDNGNQ